MATTTLRKVGNGQALYLSKALCDQAGASLGDEFRVRVVGDCIMFTPVRPERRRLRAAELFREWKSGDYELPEDIPGAGHEAEWGVAAGKEAW